jgi:2-polyprenyl-6-methoxyphenol hydroxylase-like FAD-dependent oxidoreductase
VQARVTLIEHWHALNVASYRKDRLMPQRTEPAKQLQTRCCIVGGGPAGMMLGFLLARAGIDAIVLEKHADFLRDFRGDTVHPSTLEVIYELGLLQDFLKRPHSEVRQLAGKIGSEQVVIADFSHVPARCKFIAFMPQWDFLNFIAEYGAACPTFHLKKQAEVTGLLENNGRITGVKADTPDGPLDVMAELVVGADGRHSIVRQCAGLIVEDLGAPIDVLWMRLSKHPGDPEITLGNINAGRFFVMLDRGEYWQCGFVIRKGGYEELRQQGIESFRQTIAAIVPPLRDRVRELKDWDDIKLLTVAVDHLREWYRAGLLCIGDAAHAMSPVGGVGINLAVQDAVAAANILAPQFLQGAISINHLKRVQGRREFPTRMTQRLQVFIQNNIITRVLGGGTPRSLPLPFRLLRRWPVLRRIPARLIGIGFCPEHVRTPPSC